MLGQTGLAAAAAGLTLAGCGGRLASSPAASGAASASAALTPVKLQLQWVAQAQFAGYYAALDQEFYEAEGLAVEIVEGGPDIVPQDVLSAGDVDYAISWVPKVLGSIEKGAKITNVAQIFERSGTTQISFKDKNITSTGDLRGKNVGSWGYGNEWELFAGMQKAGVGVGDIKLVQQAFDMNGFLAGDIDAAQAMTYNEYAQVLESENPKTGQLFTPDDLDVISWNDVGTNMLQDAIWANSDKLSSDATYQDADDQVRQGVDQGLGLRARQRRGGGGDRHGGRLAARREPPAVADQRGEQADLAVRERRHRDDLGRGVAAHGRHREGHQERDRRDDHHRRPARDGQEHDLRREGPRRAQDRGRRRRGQGLHAPHGDAAEGRRLTAAELLRG